MRPTDIALALLLALSALPAAANETPSVLTLDEVIAIALERNPDLEAAAARVVEAQARVGEAEAAFYPQIGTRLSYARTDNPSLAFGMILAQRQFSSNLNFNDPGPTQNVRPEILGAVPLFRGGQDYQRREAARHGASAAELERSAVRNALVDSAIASYYALVAAPEQVDATRASVLAVDAALGNARARVEAGTALKSDVLSLDVRLAAAREAQLRAQNAVELARSGLRTLLALAADAPVEITQVPVASPNEVPDTFEQALQLGAAQRPELKAAGEVVAMREHELQSERAAYLPRIDLLGTYGQDSENLKLSSSRDNWFFGAAAEFDVFSGFRTAERVRAAEQRLAQARAAERSTRLRFEQELRTAYLAVGEARERQTVSGTGVEAAEEALRLVQEQYQAGTVIVTRYLDAEVARADARSRAIAARYDTRRATAALRRAMGAWAEENPQ